VTSAFGLILSSRFLKRFWDILANLRRVYSMKNAVIAGFVRSPFTFATKGDMAGFRPDDIAAQTVLGLIQKTGVKREDIEDLLLGCAFPEGEQGFNLARLVVLLAKLPQSIGGVTVNRFCGSSMQAIASATGLVSLGAGEVFISAGVESMSRVPMTGFNPMPHPGLMESLPGAYMGMGQTAENVAKKYKIPRKEQEEFAVRSQQKAAGCIRGDTTQDKLATLKPAFIENGSVTAGTSSPLTDGASATLVVSDAYARAWNMRPLAKIRSFAIAGCDPEIMGIGPVAATKKALQRAGLAMKDIDIIELNEAFASQSIACIRDLNIDEAKVNLDGGAIALGHPLGATGARIAGKVASLLQREKKKFGLATQCIGGGQGIAMILEAE
jgi:acetyl-CoA acyltransferase